MAGVSAGIWCVRLGLSAVILDSGENPGGLLNHLPNPIEDYPGWEGSGQELAEFLAAQVKRTGVQFQSSTEVTRITHGRVDTSSASFVTEAVIVATGLRRRHLIPEREQLRGIYYGSSTRVDEFKGTITVVAGGGDGAFENALAVSRVASEVHVVIRSDVIRARPEFVRQVRECENIFLHFNTIITDIYGRDSVDLIVLHGPAGEWNLKANRLIIKLGFEPVSSIVEGLCRLDEHGFVLVDREQRTDKPGIWAAGDVCTPLDPSLAVSAGQGAVAARSLERYIRNHD
jgi:thioredoxin reductase (NADPH)